MRMLVLLESTAAVADDMTGSAAPPAACMHGDVLYFYTARFSYAFIPSRIPSGKRPDDLVIGRLRRSATCLYTRSHPLEACLRLGCSTAAVVYQVFTTLCCCNVPKYTTEPNPVGL